MFSREQLREAYEAADAANSARDRMQEAAAAFDAAQSDFNQAARIAAVVFGPTDEEQSERGEYLASPLGQFIKTEGERLKEANGKEAAVNVKLEDWSKAFDIREAIAKKLRVDEKDFHVVLTPGGEEMFHGVSLMYMAERGITMGDNKWESIMADNEDNRRKFCVTLDDGETPDSRSGMTKVNYEAMVAQALALDPESPIDRVIPYKKGVHPQPDYRRQSWLTGEPSYHNDLFVNKRAALVGLVVDGSVRYGGPSTEASHHFRFRPGFTISTPRPKVPV